VNINGKIIYYIKLKKCAMGWESYRILCEKSSLKIVNLIQSLSVALLNVRNNNKHIFSCKTWKVD
jgi:hypothetical protein